MSTTKIYRYENLRFKAPKGTEIKLYVKFVTDGNFGPTYANIPGDNDPVISNSGTCSLGRIEDLLQEETLVVSDIANPVPEEDTIALTYELNGTEMVAHSKPKSASDRQMIILRIKFETP
jgi:hypothetical protein